jgi:hypothetical protein
MKKEEHFLFSRASGANTKKVDWMGWKRKSIYSYMISFFFSVSVDEMRFYVHI